MKLRHERFFRSSLATALPAPHELKLLLRSTYDQWAEDKGPRLAAALAYYSVLSLSPLLVIAMAVAGVAFRQQSVQTALVAQMQGLVGSAGAAAVQEVIREVHIPVVGPLAGIAGALFLLIGASAVFAELQDALNTIWHVKSSNSGLWQLICERFLCFGMILAIGFLLLVSLVLSAILAAVGRFATDRLPSSEVALQFLGTLVSLGVATLLFAMMFKMLPRTSVEWNDVWIGAVATAVMFDLGKLMIALYLGRSSFASAYGAASSLVVFIAWVYYSAWILYFGAEFTKVYAWAHHSRAALIGSVARQPRTLRQVSHGSR